MRKELRSCKRIVVKAGTSILTSSGGKISDKNLARLGNQILDLMKAKKEIVLVSSGAIAYGMESISLRKRPKEMPRLQACAAIGQGKLMYAYEQFFSKSQMHTAQILLTRDGLENRTRFLAARRTLEELFKIKSIPIVNENDTVATEEIAFGDNDILSVQVSHLIEADLLIILSDVDGFYLRDGSRIREVASEAEIDNELVRHLRDSKKEKTVGGMRAKLKSAKVAMGLGVPLLIVNGHDENVLKKALEGEDVGTLFCASDSRKNAREKWIAYAASRKGSLVLDHGASEALKVKKRSLLPSGITKVKGLFGKGDVIELEAQDGTVIGRGVSRFTSAELSQIAGKKTQDIQEILGYKSQGEVIHRNDLVLWRA